MVAPIKLEHANLEGSDIIRVYGWGAVGKFSNFTTKSVSPRKTIQLKETYLRPVLLTTNATNIAHTCCLSQRKPIGHASLATLASFWLLRSISFKCRKDCFNGLLTGRVQFNMMCGFSRRCPSISSTRLPRRCSRLRPRVPRLFEAARISLQQMPGSLQLNDPKAKVKTTDLHETLKRVHNEFIRLDVVFSVQPNRDTLAYSAPEDLQLQLVPNKMS